MPDSRSAIAAVIPARPPPMTTTRRGVTAPAAGPCPAALAGLASGPAGLVMAPRGSFSLIVSWPGHGPASWLPDRRGRVRPDSDLAATNGFSAVDSDSLCRSAAAGDALMCSSSRR